MPQGIMDVEPTLISHTISHKNVIKPQTYSNGYKTALNTKNHLTTLFST